MKKILFVFCSCLFLLSGIANAKVYWVGRNIALSPNNPNRTKMLSAWGHSYIVIIPDNPTKAKQASALYAKYEKQLGCNKRGVVIGAYPSRGTEQLGDLDGYLTAQINADKEKLPTAHFLCGTQAQKKQWNFVSGVVTSKLKEEQFIANLMARTQDYITVTRRNPVDYHATRSLVDAVTASNAVAQNCNSFAFSLLAFSEASVAPDIGATRILPGNRHLLPQYLFYTTPVLQPAGYVPEVIKNDNVYRKRVETERELRANLIDYNNKRLATY